MSQRKGHSMLILPPNPNLAVIEFTVTNFVSVRQGGRMVTSGQSPDVTTSLSVTPPRVSRQSNSVFEFSSGGGPPVDLAFAVLPSGEYAAVGLIVQKVTADDDGGGVWDRLTVGNGPNDNVIYVRNTGKPTTLPPITYEIYMLIRRRDAGGDYPFGDIGVIDPSWINR